MTRKQIVVAAFCLFVCSIAVLADTLKLKDGTTLEGKVIPQGESYWIKLASGETKVVPKSQVASYTKGDSPTPAPTPTPAAPSEGAKPSTPATPAAGSAGLSATYAAIKAKADKVEQPIVAVQMWDKFIDTDPAPADLAAAKIEKANWEKLQKDHAERIGGKWVGGEERKTLMKEVEKLVKEGYAELTGSQTVDGLAKLEKALKMYPNSFDANFELGYYYLTKGVMGVTGRGNLAELDKGIKALETAQRILPKSPATLSNLAIGYSFRKRYSESITCAYQAAKIREDKDIVQNLMNAIYNAPSGIVNNSKLKPMIEDAQIIARKHGIGRAAMWPYIRPNEQDEEGDGDGVTPGGQPGKAPPGAAWSGSGFFVSADGYIITNHHVATGDPKTPINKDISFNVRMDDGSSKNAELIAVDDKADIALMKIKVDKPVPYFKIADNDPNQGASALVLGYPATGEDHPALQISPGSVKSIDDNDDYNVWFDLNTTHGNSGGPIVDRSGRVIAILSAGRTVYNMTITMGVGPKQMKRFIDSIADKAPKLEYTALPDDAPQFDAEKLTIKARKSTLYIVAIRGAGDALAAGEGKPAEGSKPGAGDEGGGSGPGTAGGKGAGKMKPDAPAD